MSFSRVNPGGWGVGAKFTSSQANQLDIDHANALDKSAAGDSIAGTVNFTGAGNIVANLPSAITTTITGGIVSGVAGGIEATHSQGVLSAIAGGIAAGVTAGITDGGIGGGIKPTVGGGIWSNVAEGIISTVASGITSLAASGIESAVAAGISSVAAGGIATLTDGGFIFAGTSADYATYNTTRSVTRRYPLGSVGVVDGTSLGSAWTNGYLNGPFVKAGATTTLFSFPLNSLMGGQLNGAALGAASLEFAVGASHNMAGVTPPLVTLARMTGANIGGLTGVTTLFTGTMPAGTGGPGTGFGGGVKQTYSIPLATGPQIIDTGTYDYVFSIVDENGGAAIGGNVYQTLVLTFQGINNSAPW